MRYAAQPIFAGIFAITLVLSNATRTLADGYVSWCIDQEISRVKEVAINNASEGSCFVTMQEPFEGSEQKVTTYTGQDWETCFNKGAELTQDIIDAADGYNCGAWSWAGNVAISHKKLMEGVLSTIQSYNETVRQWNEGEKKYTDVGLREVALIFPAGDEFWADGQELDLADLYLLATYGRYVEGFNWPQVFAKAMRADGFVPYDPDDPTTNETVLEFGDVEDGACHGNDGKHLTTVDYQSTLIVNLLEGYEDCEGRHKRKVLETEKYFLELQGEGIWELKKLN